MSCNAAAQGSEKRRRSCPFGGDHARLAAGEFVGEFLCSDLQNCARLAAVKAGCSPEAGAVAPHLCPCWLSCGAAEGWGCVALVGSLRTHRRQRRKALRRVSPPPRRTPQQSWPRRQMDERAASSSAPSVPPRRKTTRPSPRRRRRRAPRAAVRDDASPTSSQTRHRPTRTRPSRRAERWTSCRRVHPNHHHYRPHLR